MVQTFSCKCELAPVYKEQSGESALVTQLLEGEPFYAKMIRPGWVFGKPAHDGTEGWVPDRYLEYGATEAKKWFEKQAIDKGEQPLIRAMTYLDAPHMIGGLTAKGMDDSGLVYRAHLEVGKPVPHSIVGLVKSKRFKVISTIRAAVGDLIVYKGQKSQVPKHVAFCASGGLILHSTKNGVVLELEPSEIMTMPRVVLRLKS